MEKEAVVTAPTSVDEIIAEDAIAEEAAEEAAVQE